MIEQIIEASKNATPPQALILCALIFAFAYVLGKLFGGKD